MEKMTYPIFFKKKIQIKLFSSFPPQVRIMAMKAEVKEVADGAGAGAA